MPASAGDNLLHYRLLRKLGEGGMGEVYLADDTRLKRQVAIKVLSPRLGDDPDFLALFRREAESAARLNHPAIATIHALEETPDTTFIVMEYVEGCTLADAIRNGRLPLDVFFATFIPLVEGLAHAHALGLVHRDLKPGNVMITPTGTPKILDFGLARAVDAVEPPPPTANSPTMTRPLEDAVALVGTPSYMSPEQIERARVDPRSDVFSVGVMMFEALTGRPPFEGQSVASLLARVLESEPRPIVELRPDAPAELSWIIRACLRKRPEARIQTAPELLASLRDAQPVVGRTAATPVPYRQGWKLAAILAPAALLAGAALGWSFKPMPPSDLPLRTFTREIAPYSSVVEAFVDSSAISPDGRLLAYNDASGGATALWIRDLASVIPRELAGTRGAMAPFWSPDSRHVAFFTGNTPATLTRTAVDGGSPEVLCELPGRRPRGAVWLSNGTIVFGVPGDDEQTTGTLYVMPEGGGTPTVFAEADAAGDERGLMFPSVLPDGETLLFAASVGADGGALVAWRDGRRTVVYRDALERLAYPVFSPSGHIVFQRGFTTSKGVWAVPFDPGRLESTGEAFLIDAEGAAPTVAADATLVYGSSAQLENLPGQLVWVDRQGRLERIDQVRQGLGTPALSPDGGRVAFDALQHDNRDVFVLDLRQNRLTRLTFDRARDRFPVWSPDSRRLAFQSFRSGGGDIYAVPADGSADEVLLVSGRRNDTPNGWSRDGSALLYTYFADDTGQDLMLAPIGDRGGLRPAADPKPLLRTRRNEGWGQVSPDGRFIVYDSSESGQFEIFVTTYPEADQRWQISAEGGSWPRWSPAGDEIFYIGGGVATGYGPILRVPVRTTTRFEHEPAEVVFDRLPGVSFAWFSVSPDAARFLAIEKQAGQTPKVTLTVVQNWARELTAAQRPPR